jgi:subtilisin family serine protease
MKRFAVLFVLILSLAMLQQPAIAADTPDAVRDILVTFDNSGARVVSSNPGAPYSQRKRYSIARSARNNADALARQYNLLAIDHWPIKSLSIYCFVFRVAEGVDRQTVIDQLAADARVESAQPLQTFETSFAVEQEYDDTYANLQYGLDILNIVAAHRASTGLGVRIAIIDSSVDQTHEDLQGRIESMRSFSGEGVLANDEHGTAVASVIGARSNNALGIVGIAPDSSLEIFVSCWDGGEGRPAVCDSFSLSKALDTMLENPPDILNLSLRGPRDPLLERLLSKAAQAGVVMVAAGAGSSGTQTTFPSSVDDVIGVSSSHSPGDLEQRADILYAPGEQILVALPVDQYDFRSGSSLAAAHASGVVALLLAIDRNLGAAAIYEILSQSQHSSDNGALSIDACQALNLASKRESCIVN